MSIGFIVVRIEQNDQIFLTPSTKSAAAPSSLSVLRSAAMRLAETRKKPRLKTRDLVGLLLSHSARAWRSSLPHVSVKLAVLSPSGKPAVRYGYQRPVKPTH